MDAKELQQAKELLLQAMDSSKLELIDCIKLCFIKIHQLETSIHCQGWYPLELAARDFNQGGAIPK